MKYRLGEGQRFDWVGVSSGVVVASLGVFVGVFMSVWAVNTSLGGYLPSLPYETAETGYMSVTEPWLHVVVDDGTHMPQAFRPQATQDGELLQGSN